MVYSFKYDVSIRFRHPTMNPEEICEKLGLQALHKWLAGTQRKTPKGVLLEGVYEESYCTFKLEPSKDYGLIDFLTYCNQNFCSYKEFFEKIRLTGGSIEYFIGLYFDKNGGEIFDWKLLSQLGELKIDLSLDFYPS